MAGNLRAIDFLSACLPCCLLFKGQQQKTPPSRVSSDPSATGSERPEAERHPHQDAALLQTPARGSLIQPTIQPDGGHSRPAAGGQNEHKHGGEEP